MEGRRGVVVATALDVRTWGLSQRRRDAEGLLGARRAGGRDGEAPSRPLLVPLRLGGLARANSGAFGAPDSDDGNCSRKGPRDGGTPGCGGRWPRDRRAGGLSQSLRVRGGRAALVGTRWRGDANVTERERVTGFGHAALRGHSSLGGFADWREPILEASEPRTRRTTRRGDGGPLARLLPVAWPSLRGLAAWREPILELVEARARRKAKDVPPTCVT